MNLNARLAAGIGIRHVAQGIYFMPPSMTGDLGPERVQFAGRELERFMDHIYLASSMEELSPAQISVVNDVRLGMMRSARVRKVNRLVKSAVASLLQVMPKPTILEWGCGYDTLMGRCGEARYIATDIDSKVVRHQRDNGVECYSPEDVGLRVEAGSVDCIPAVFVFHYRIFDRDIEGMARVLRPGGVVIANVYKRSEASREQLEKSFVANGFGVSRHADQRNLCAEHEYWFIVKDQDLSGG